MEDALLEIVNQAIGRYPELSGYEQEICRAIGSDIFRISSPGLMKGIVSSVCSEFVSRGGVTSHGVETVQAYLRSVGR